MSEAQNEFIKGIASILNVTDEKVIKKGTELIALLSLKPQVNCSGTCKGVICLDIASSLSSNPIKREDAIKYSGCKKGNYINMYNIISKLLNLDKVYSIKEICLLTNVCYVKEHAMQLLEKFKSNCDKIHYDFEHPMYACAAVWAVCRNTKIKVNYTKLVEISRVKKAELDELTKKFQELINIKKPKEQIQAIKSCSGSTPTLKRKSMFETEEKSNSKIMTDEQYLEWKRRMLEE